MQKFIYSKGLLLMVTKNTFIPYDLKSIKLLQEATVVGSIPANLIAPIVLLYIIHDYISVPVASVWFVLQIMLFFSKISIASRLKKLLEISSFKIKRCAFLLFTTIITSSILNSHLILYSVWNNYPTDTILMMTIVIITLSAGSLTTLLSIYKFFFLYVVTSMLPLIFVALFYFDGTTLSPLYLILTIFTIVVLKAGHHQYLTLQNLLALEEERKFFQEELKKRVIEEVEKNRQKDKAMIQQSKMAQMGEMMSMIAHQWRQPLSAISAATTSLQLKLKMEKLDKDTGVKLTSNIVNYTQHLSSTIDDFRNFFKEAKTKETTTLVQLVEETLHILQTSLKQKNITIETKVVQECDVQTYASEFKQVLLNIIKNAEDALVTNKITDPKISITINCNTLEIEDNGGGIEESIITKIFDPYFSTKTQKDGTGLGLYMSKMIIHEHCNGTLEVQNTPQGALFSIKISN